MSGGFIKHSHSPNNIPPPPPAELDRIADAFLAAAGQAAMKDDWRACADNYLRAYKGCSSSWTLKYNVWSGFCSLLREGNMRVEPEDMKELKLIADDVNAPTLHRIQAYFSMGFVANAMQDAKLARDAYSWAIRTATELTDAERREHHTVATHAGYEPTPAGEISDSLVQFANDNLRTMGVGGGLMNWGDDNGGSTQQRVHQHTPGTRTHQHTPKDEVEAAFDQPIVATKSAMEYSRTYFEIAMRRRAKERGWPGSDGGSDDASSSTRQFGTVSVSASGEAAAVGESKVGLTAPMKHTSEFETELPLPQPSPRICHVHECALLQEDLDCLQANGSSSGCTMAWPDGHLQPMGQQFPSPTAVDEMWPDSGSHEDFWRRHVGAFRPLVIRGVQHTTEVWDDEFLESHCQLENGLAWRALIEKNNRVVQNDRHPLMYDWTFCDFIRSYKAPEYKNMLYVVTPLSDTGVSLPKHLYIPQVLRCSEVHQSIHEARLWMSNGNTTSSLHFDTHENILMQIDGTKEVYMWHPKESHKFYSDFHNKFGLSPISADHVDLERYPEFAKAATMKAVMGPGDALYIPDGWWHLVRSFNRNIAIAVEFEPFNMHDTERHWPSDVLARYRWPGLFWEEQIRIKYEMRERLGASRYTSIMTGKPITCESAPVKHPMLFAEIAQQMGA